MNRRRFLAALRPGSTKPKGVPACGVAFISALNTWIAALNRVRPGTIDLIESEAWEPISALFRRLEDARRKWIQGLAVRQ
jgi:hypothetical protein